MPSVASDAPRAAPPAPPAAGPARWRWSRADYHRLGDLGFFAGRRVQLVRGEVVQMSPIGWPHKVGVGNTADILKELFAGRAFVDVQGPIPVGDSEPEPDVAVYAGRRKDYTDHPTAALLLVEVADASLGYDLTVKAGLYAEAGVPEYWVVDVAGRVVHVLRDPRPVAAGGCRYFDTRLLTAADAVSPVAAPAAVVRVADLLP